MRLQLHIQKHQEYLTILQIKELSLSLGTLTKKHTGSIIQMHGDVIKIKVKHLIKCQGILLSIIIIRLTVSPYVVGEWCGWSIEVIAVIPPPVTHVCAAWDRRPASCPYLSTYNTCQKQILSALHNPRILN